MKEPPRIGQVLYSLNVGNAMRCGVEQKLTPMTVTEIGRKYFTCHPVGWENLGYNGIQFYLENWREKAEFCIDHELYESEQAWTDKKDSNAICDELWKTFEYGKNTKNIPLETLRKIKELIP